MAKNFNNPEIIRVIEKDGRFTFEIEDVENKKCFKHERWYWKKACCIKGISRVMEKYDAQIK